ncbi:MAG: hypothetical protein LBG06_07665 [Deltaproteobacteria bacterium]|jgi:hypothetical protein|nr:hypothetical protein [Deltaproteobacteria bacterium]
MLLFYGVLGALQAVLLPGAALAALLAPSRASAPQFLCSSFALSLVANYLLAFAFLGAGLPPRTAWSGAALLSLAVILARRGRLAGIFARRAEGAPAPGPGPAAPVIPLGGPASPPPAAPGLPARPGPAVLASFAAALLGFLLIIAFREKVYAGIDPILSWNSWAMDWASGRYPVYFGDYPQLMPILMGLPAALGGAGIPQIFAILALNSFVFFAILAFWTLRGTPHAAGAAVAALGTVWLRRYTGAGYADLLVGVTALTAFAALQWHLEARGGGAAGGSGEGAAFYLWLAFAAAAACAVLKQSGLFWLPFFALIARETLAGAGLTRREILRALWGPCLAAAAVAVPWYVYNRYLMSLGVVNDMTAFFLSGEPLYKGMGLLERALRSIVKYSYYTLFAVPALACLKVKGYRWLSLSCLSLMAAWALFFSYGPGNVKFPVMLGFFPLGCWLARMRRDGRLARARRLAGRAVALAGRAALARPAELLAASLIVLAMASLAGSGRLDRALQAFHDGQVLTLGEPGLTRRVDWLEKACPAELLSADGRLRQLRSYPRDGFSLYGGLPWLEDPSRRWGYVVVHRDQVTGQEKEILDSLYRLDYAEKDFILFVRKDLPCL